MVAGLGIPLHSSAANLQFVGRAHVKGKQKWLRHVLVTINLLGLQLVWSTEMAYASPYLLSLGLSKSGMSAVFLAGPLSGLIVQPIIGAVADKSKSRFGRRRPVIVIGCLICAVSLLIFGYTREVASVFTSWGSNAHSTLTIWLAVFAVYALDFAINGVMAADRALIVDVLPASQQEEANAWAARLSGAGSVLGFWIGNVDLTYAFGFLGSSQVKILSVFATFALLAFHIITIFSVEERVLLDDGRLENENESYFAPALNSIKEIWSTFRTLPSPIWDICKVQAFAWGGWFPVLFFSTTYVAEIFDRQYPTGDIPSNDRPTSTGPHDADPGTRAGSRAMFLHSVFAFIMSIILPLLVSPITRPPSSRKSRLSDDQGTYAIHWSDSPFSRFLQRLPTIPFPWLDLNLLWAISHIAFACLMFATWIAGSVWSATLLLTILGFSWAVTCWAPTSLLAQEILQDQPAGNKPSRANTIEFQAIDHHYQNSREADPLMESNGGTPASNTLNLSFSSQSTSTSLSSSPGHVHSRSPKPDNGQPTHPPPLEVSKKLRALNSSPPRIGAISPTSRPSANVTTGRTLQIRHSDSYEDLSSVASDTEEEDQVTPKLPSVPLPGSMAFDSRHSLNDTPRIGHEDIDLDRYTALAFEAGYLEHGGESVRTADQAGAILGIANIFVVLPQFLTSFISSIVFAFLAPSSFKTGEGALEAPSIDDESSLDEIGRLLGKRAGMHVGEASDGAIGFVFRVGGLSALVAAWLCWQMRHRKKAALGGH